MQLNIKKLGDLLATASAQKDAIDNAAGSARARYITTVAGQAETYLRKSEDARRYIAAGETGDTSDYPWVEADAEAFGLTPTQAAVAILEQESIWQSIGTNIERTRLGYKRKIDQATTTAQINQIAREAIQLLEAI